MKKDLEPYCHVSPGDIVSIRFAGMLRHYGVATTSGTVISNSRRHGGVTEQSLAGFADGRSIRVHSDGDVGHPIAVEARARRSLGASYRLAGSNCGDFVGYAHRRKPTMTQVGRASLMALGDLISQSRRR